VVCSCSRRRWFSLQQRAQLADAAQPVEHVLVEERLLDVVVGAQPHRLDGVLDGRVGGHHQHLGVRPRRFAACSTCMPSAPGSRTSVMTTSKLVSGQLGDRQLAVGAGA
jgi:hypothetical protein